MFYAYRMQSKHSLTDKIWVVFHNFQKFSELLIFQGPGIYNFRASVVPKTIGNNTINTWHLFAIFEMIH